MAEKYGFVYIWYDTRRERFYVGSHWGYENDGYICSSNWMRKAYRRRPEDFKRRIIKRVYTTRQELLEVEHKYLQMIHDNELGKRYYNLTKHLNGHWTAGDNTLTIREKISIKTKEAMQRPEVKEKYKEGLKTRVCVKSEDGARRHREAMIKYWEEQSPVENRQTWLDKNSEELKEIHRNNTSKLWKNEEYRTKVIRKGQPFNIDGKDYEFLTEAGKELGFSKATVRNRLLSKSFPNWNYI